MLVASPDAVGSAGTLDRCSHDSCESWDFASATSALVTEHSAQADLAYIDWPEVRASQRPPTSFQKLTRGGFMTDLLTHPGVRGPRSV